MQRERVRNGPVGGLPPRYSVVATKKVVNGAVCTGAMITPRGYHTATLLSDVVGHLFGGGTSAELYDPDTRD